MSHRSKRGRSASQPGHQPGGQPPRQQRRLHVVIPVLLTPEEFPGELGGSYQAACQILGLDVRPAGWGLVLAQDDAGARWTQVTTDTGGISSARAIWNSGLECGYEPPDSTVTATRPGWPVECAAGFDHLAEPHDPPGVPAAEILRPLQGRSWTPARRRAMADIIAGELTDLLYRGVGEYTDAWHYDMSNLGDNDPGPPPARLIDMLADIDADHPAAERSLAQAWSLAGTARPPPGSIRTRKATGRSIMIRATGDDWTLAARTDGPVVLLLDEAPGVPWRVSADAAGFSQLLDALAAAAARTPAS
jgi:hypothetical protein